MAIPKYIVISIISVFILFIGITQSSLLQGYVDTPTTNKCISCHDGMIAPYKRPHNDTVMCEKCHDSDVHGIRYIQPDGTLILEKETAATCKDCHELGVLGFNAPLVPELKHSSKINNGSVWGSYWTSEKSNSCEYCHGDTKHDIIALGKIINLTSDPANIKNFSIETTTWCADCHYSAADHYNGYLWTPAPPLINIKNTNNDRWTNHTIFLVSGYGDIRCKSCHPMNGTYPNTSANYVHSMEEISGDACTVCHGSDY